MKRVAVAGVLAALMALSGPGVAVAQDVTVTLADTATLLEDGNVAIDVTVSCPKKHDVLEAFVYITQDGHTSQFAGIPIRKCKTKPRTYTVVVRPLDQPFHEGAANATAYVLVTTPDGGDTRSGGDGRPITIE